MDLILKSQFNIKSAELELFSRINNIDKPRESYLSNDSLELHIKQLKKEHLNLLQKYTTPILLTEYGTFNVSQLVLDNFTKNEITRDNPKLIQFITENGLQKCSGNNCILTIKFIPICTNYTIINDIEGKENIQLHPFELYLPILNT